MDISKILKDKYVKLDLNWKSLPIEAYDINSSKCRIPSELFNIYNISINDIIIIKLNQNFYICQAWPFHYSLDKNYNIDSNDTIPIQFDKLISINEPNYKQLSSSKIEVYVISKRDTSLISPKTNSKLEHGLYLSHKLIPVAKELTVCFVGESIINTNNLLKKEQIHALLVSSFVCKGSLISYVDPSIQNGIKVLSVNILVKNQLKETNSFTRVGKDTIVNIVYSYSINHNITKYDNEKDNENLNLNFGGYNDVLLKLKEMIEYPNLYKKSFQKLNVNCPKGIILYGPPGVGKTFIVKELSRYLHIPLVSIHVYDIQSSTLGQTEHKLRMLFDHANKIGTCIIFIDEIDIICGNRESSGETESRLVAQFLTLMDSTDCVIIATTNRIQSIDPALRRPGRFDREIEMPLPNLGDRISIINLNKYKMKWSEDIINDWDNFTRRTALKCQSWSGADITSLLREAAIHASQRFYFNKDNDKTSSTEGICEDDIEYAFTRVFPSSRRGIITEFPSTRWDDIGGLESVKEKLKMLVEWPILHADTFKRLNLEVPKGILLYGPPGCSKTSLVRALASSLGLPLISLKPADIYSQYVGESERQIRELFKRARKARPVIIFFDEIDTIVGDRNGESKSENVGILTQLLTEMDGVESMQGESESSKDLIIIIAATNRIDKIDKALLRPGRFDSIIEVPLPDRESRKKIFEIYTSRMPLDKDFNIDELLDKTEGYSGADIENLCKEAAISALKEDLNIKNVKMKHFKSILMKI